MSDQSNFMNCKLNNMINEFRNLNGVKWPFLEEKGAGNHKYFDAFFKVYNSRGFIVAFQQVRGMEMNDDEQYAAAKAVAEFFNKTQDSEQLSERGIIETSAEEILCLFGKNADFSQILDVLNS